MTADELKARYGQSDGGNFRIVDTIGVPHPYCIGPKHVTYAADHCGGMLGAAAIEAAEKHGAHCCICHGKLAYAAHETALLVESKVEELNGNPELHAFLLKCKPLAEADHFAGFAFTRVHPR